MKIEITLYCDSGDATIICSRFGTVELAISQTQVLEGNWETDVNLLDDSTSERVGAGLL